MIRRDLTESQICLAQEALLYGAMPKAMQTIAGRIEPHAGKSCSEEWDVISFDHGSPSPSISRKVKYRGVPSACVHAVHLSEAVESSYGAELGRCSRGKRDLLYPFAELDRF